MYGVRTAVARKIESEPRRVPNLVLVRGGLDLPRSRQAFVHSPEEDESIEVVVGAQAGCATQADAANLGQQMFPCTNNLSGSPTFLATGDVSIPALTAGVVVTLLPVEPGVLIDWGVSDSSGQLLLTSIKIGRVDIMEGGAIRSEALNALKTMCKSQVPFPVTPYSGVKITLTNPTQQAIPVNIYGPFLPSPCAPAPSQTANPVK